jgi:iron complex outermembrane receptor protein
MVFEGNWRLAKRFGCHTRNFAAAGVLAVSAAMACAQAPPVGGASALQGTIADSRGAMIPKAAVSIKNDTTGQTITTAADGEGHFSVPALAPGSYTVQASAPGFALTAQKVVITADQPGTVALALAVTGTTDTVEVDANATGSVAAALAPMDALLGETSARTEVNQSFINNFASPIADYGELVEMTPGTFTTNSDGVGLGQSKTYFRGFPDGDFDIDFDGIPFYDTNTPTHHSWAFFPSEAIGSIDFDRSPGTASTIGPTPFGGSIHLLSRDLSPLQNVRATFSGGSYNTYLYDAQYDSGDFGPGRKFNLTTDVHHVQSHGWQTLNNQAYNSGDIKVQYKWSPKTILTGYSGVIWVDANTPNFSATRCQMYGSKPAYASSCIISGTTPYPYTGAGINFLLTNSSDPLLYLDTKYNYYHVPTDFEYVGVHKEFGHNFVLDVKPYTYNYDNSEKYANATTITELTSASFPATSASPKGTYLGLPVNPCDVAVTKKGISAIPCGVDKYNSYRKYGETSELSQVSKIGILRAGLWYEWANTNRHQYPSDPLNNWHDQPLPNFKENFLTDSYQPFVEYEYHATSKLSVTPGVKFAYYTINTRQYADDGKTIGGLGTSNPATFITNGGSYFATLPSLSINYRLYNGLSVYGQAAQGSIVPPSSVFDYTQSTVPGKSTPVMTLPKQQKNTTYQFGTVAKTKYLTFDADYFHIHFDQGYSSVLGPDGEPVFYVQPSSITEGLEAEGNVYLTHGFSVYLNGTYDHAVYEGKLAATCTGTCTNAPVLDVTVPKGIDVQQTPLDTETEGFTYQHASWDVGLFDKRIGTLYIDNGAYHNQYTVHPFSLTNIFVNYTIRNGGRFNNTKLRLSVNNVFNSNSITGISLAGTATPETIASNGFTYTNPFVTSAPTAINGQDNVSVLPGRSIMLTVTFGTSPSR